MKLSKLFAIVFLFSLNLFAHVTVEPKTAVAGDYAKLVFRVPHGCDGSATTKITVKLPEGALSVKPQVHAGWKITIKKTKLAKPASLHGKEVTEAVSEVTWAGGPLADEYMDEFGLSLKLPDTSGDVLFPVLQVCKQGESNWSDTPASEHVSHGHTLPAPMVKLTK